MTDRQAQYRASKAKARQAKRDAGFVPLEVWVPLDGVADIRALEAGLARGGHAALDRKSKSCQDASSDEWRAGET